jgi:hypothetical protein
MTGYGRLQHHFWGVYCATIGLKFDSIAHALQAQQIAFPMFEASDNNPCVLVFHGGGSELKAAESALRAHGADMRKVGSLKYSIDYGEPFTVTVIASDGSVQTPLVF